MKKKLIILSFLFVSVHIKAKKKDFMDYVYSSKEVKSLDGLEIRNSEEKIYQDRTFYKIIIKYKGIDIKIDPKKSIPKEICDIFIKKNAYVNSKRPLLIWQTGENKIENLTVDNYIYKENDQDCKVPLFFTKTNKNIIQFVLCSFRIFDKNDINLDDLNTIFNFSLYSYDKKEKRVLSGIPLYLAEITDITKEGIHIGTVAPHYQTIGVKDGIVKQSFNDGMNLRRRHIRLNDKGYYEIVWAEGTDDDPWKYYEGEINDPDGYVNVRETPDSKSKVYYKLKDKQKVIVTDYDENNKWYLIDSIGGEKIDIKSVGGWIHKSRVKIEKRIRNYDNN